MARVMLIGGIGAGKTSLKQRLSAGGGQATKTQVLTYSDSFIDCPGEYLEIPRYYHVLIDASHMVEEIWALQDAGKLRAIYPPGFAKVFNKPVVGIVTKIDLPEADPEAAAAQLRHAGLEGPIYLISSLSGAGCDDLLLRLKAIEESGPSRAADNDW
jgi:ethanolamine utilization protein EutP